jgi:hypothetical protein
MAESSRLKRFSASALLIAMLVGGFAYSYSITKPSGEIKNNPPQTETQNTNLRKADQEKQKNDQGADENSYTNEAIAFFTLVLTIITGVQVYFFRMKERAWICPVTIEATGNIQKDGTIVSYDFAMEWKNTGATPAKNVTMTFNGDSFDGDIPDGYAFPGIHTEGTVSTYMSPEGDAMGDTRTIDMQTLDLVRKKKRRLFFWGWTEYEDVLWPLPLWRRKHKTSFLWELVAIKRTHEGGLRFLFRHDGRLADMT